MASQAVVRCHGKGSIPKLTRAGLRLVDMPGNMGIPTGNLSGFEKFEGPDPAEWSARGYAVVNIDSRGSWDSHGYLW